MILGVLFACGNGAALPVLMIVFGDMTDGFVTQGIASEYADYLREDCLGLGRTLDEINAAIEAQTESILQ